jgi:hypothetical protein
MSIVTLFRREALKHQYKSAEFGEAIVTTPSVINRSIALLFVSLVILVFLSYVVPVKEVRKINLNAHESNFYPVIYPVDSIVEHHYIPNGSRVVKNSTVSQLRVFKNDNSEHSIGINSKEDGNYFHVAEPGQVVKAFSPIGKILREKSNNTYLFTIIFPKANILHINQFVTLVSENKAEYQGKIISVKKLSNKECKLGIKLTRPYDISLISPLNRVKLIIPNEKKNIFELIKGQT